MITLDYSGGLEGPTSALRNGSNGEVLWDADPLLRIISLGAGVQSSVMLLMAAYGELLDKNGKPLPMPDYAIFADTGWEPKGVYDHLAWLEKEVRRVLRKTRKKRKGIPRRRDRWGQLRPNLKLVRTSVPQQDKQGRFRRWSIQKHIEDGTNSTGQEFVSVPFYIRNKDGKGGISRRQCTREYKLEPLRRATRDLAGVGFRQRMPKGAWVEQWIGISYDEITRMKDAREPWLVSRWPLVDTEWRRENCKEWFQERYPDRILPRSACIGCPMHTNAEWLDMKENDPDSWEDAVATDHLLRQGSRKKRFKGELYLHPSLTPLKDVDLAAKMAKKEVSLLDECEGMCGV